MIAGATRRLRSNPPPRSRLHKSRGGRRAARCKPPANRLRPKSQSEYRHTSPGQGPRRFDQVFQIVSAFQLNVRKTDPNSFDHSATPVQIGACRRAKRDCRAPWRAQAREFSFQPDRALVFRFRFEPNPLRARRNQLGKAIGPLDQTNAVREKILLQSESLGRLSILQPKEIEMVNWKPSTGIFVNEGKGRAGHGGGTAQAGDDSFDELRFTAAEFADQRQHGTGPKLLRNLLADRFDLRRAIGNERSHGGDVDG